MREVLIDSPAYELAAKLEPNTYGFRLQFESFVAIARRPEVQRRFEGNLTKAELLKLRRLIDDVLSACGETQLDRPPAREPEQFPPPPMP